MNDNQDMFTDGDYFDFWVIERLAWINGKEALRDSAENGPEEAVEAPERSGWYDRIKNKKKGP